MSEGTAFSRVVAREILTFTAHSDSRTNSSKSSSLRTSSGSAGSVGLPLFSHTAIWLNRVVSTGDRCPVSPGRARNVLIPNQQAMYVVAGKAVSPLRDMMAREQLIYGSFIPTTRPLLSSAVHADPSVRRRTFYTLSVQRTHDSNDYRRRKIPPSHSRKPNQPSSTPSPSSRSSPSLVDSSPHPRRLSFPRRQKRTRSRFSVRLQSRTCWSR